MNGNFSGAVLLAILAVGGFAYDRPMAVLFAALTAALAFVADDVRNASWSNSQRISACFALASWAAVAAASISLIV